MLSSWGPGSLAARLSSGWQNEGAALRARVACLRGGYRDQWRRGQDQWRGGKGYGQGYRQKGGYGNRGCEHRGYRSSAATREGMPNERDRFHHQQEQLGDLSRSPFVQAWCQYFCHIGDPKRNGAGTRRDHVHRVHIPWTVAPDGTTGKRA